MVKQFYIAGFSTCKPFQQTRNALLGLKAIYPEEFEVTVHEC